MSYRTWKRAGEVGQSQAQKEWDDQAPLRALMAHSIEVQKENEAYRRDLETRRQVETERQKSIERELLRVCYHLLLERDRLSDSENVVLKRIEQVCGSEFLMAAWK